MSNQFDYIVVGAGIAGASDAASLVSYGRAAVLEAEEHAGYHTTGRSAALFSEIYGNRIIRALTRASRTFFFDPTHDFAPTALVTPRSALYFASRERASEADAFRADDDVGSCTVALPLTQARELVPVFSEDYLGGAALERGAADIDVDVLHQGFLRQARSAGAQIHLNCAATRIRQAGGLWTVTTANDSFSAPVLISAAGPWGDRIATMADVAPVGLLPMRRTALLIDTPAGGHRHRRAVLFQAGCRPATAVPRGGTPERALRRPAGRAGHRDRDRPVRAGDRHGDQARQAPMGRPTGVQSGSHAGRRLRCACQGFLLAGGAGGLRHPDGTCHRPPRGCAGPGAGGSRRYRGGGCRGGIVVALAVRQVIHGSYSTVHSRSPG